MIKNIPPSAEEPATSYRTSSNFVDDQCLLEYRPGFEMHCNFDLGGYNSGISIE